ncbi:hypothetical protein ACLI07_09730 [Providencia huaxiensis]|uniref:hypothetical protein n=1 Tax=Providencia huaxiensis TaxID=2027290 RepID=UPI003D2E41EF
MSDKKEIATLSIKISVDSTDLDKLEAQLKRIESLMVSTGLKQPAKGGFVADPYFGINDGQTFINSAFITSATISEAMAKVAKEGAIKGAEEAIAKAATSVSYDAQIDMSCAGKALEQLNKAFSKSTDGSAMAKTIRVNTIGGNSEFEKFKQKVESEFSYLQSSLTQIRADIQRKSSGFA